MQAVWRPNRKVWGVGLIGGDGRAEEMKWWSNVAEDRRNLRVGVLDEGH